MLRQQAVFGFEIISQLQIELAESFAHRLLFGDAKPRPVEQAIPGSACSEQRGSLPHRPDADHAQGKDGRHQCAGQQSRMQRADFTGDAEQQSQREHDERQRDVPVFHHQLQQDTADRKQRTTNEETFEEAFVRRIKTGDVTAGRAEGEQQAHLQIPEQPAQADRQT